MGSLMLGGLLFGRSLVNHSWDRASASPTRVVAHLCWGLFFYVVAAVNEVAWRNLSMDAWLNFKVFRILGMTFLFLLLQAPLLQRYALEQQATRPRATTNDDES